MAARAPHKPTAGLNAGEEASSGALILRLLALAWNYRVGVLVTLGLQLVLLTLTLSGLGLLGLGIDVIGHAFDPLTAENPAGNKPPNWPLGTQPPAEWTAMQEVGLVAAGIAAVALFRFVIEALSAFWIAQLVQNIVVSLRTRVYDKLQRLSFRFFDANESGSIINRVTGDVQAVRMFVDQVLVNVLLMTISLVFFTGYMLSLHVRLTLVCLATTPLLWFLTAWFSRVVKPAYRENRRLFDSAVRVLAENATGVHVVKGFARQREEVTKFAAANDAVGEHRRRIFRNVSIFVPLISFLPQLNLVILLLYGGWIYLHDPDFTLGTLVVFSGLLQQFSSQVGNVAQLANAVQQSLTGAARVFEILDTPLDIPERDDPVPLPGGGTGSARDAPAAAAAAECGQLRGAVTFEGVTFRYGADDDPPALGDVSFHAPAGSLTAILGATGAGKSTLLSLIPRFYDPAAGRILLDGVDLRDLKLDELRQSIGLVFQESFLFSNTVAENIAFGHPDASPEQVERAARIASAHGFVTDDLEHGYASVLTEGGNNLSGGQRQRLAIARAVLLDPPVLLMDDPTAAIDPETENVILAAMASAMENRTTFVVAHRLSTLRRADQILVLERGRIVERGTHEELMAHGQHYATAALTQTADEASSEILARVGGGA